MITCSVCRRRHVVGSEQYFACRRIGWIRAHEMGCHTMDGAAGFQAECPLCVKRTVALDICGCQG